MKALSIDSYANEIRQCRRTARAQFNNREIAGLHPTVKVEVSSR